MHPAGLRAYGYATYRFDAPEGKVFQRLKLHTQIRCADLGSADILVSTDKEHWVYLRKFSNNGHDLNAHYYDDMTGYAAGKSTVYVRFVMVSRDSNADNAWVRYINVDAYEANVRFRNAVAPIEGDLTVTGPDKTSYAAGATLDLTGLNVTDKNGNAVKNYAIDDRPAAKSANVLKDEAGTYTIPVTYLDGNGVHTGSFTVRVMEPAGELAVTAEPTNKAVVKGGTPDYTGLKVTYTDKDGVARELNADEYTVVAPDTSSVGDKTVTVQYTVGDVTLEATFTVNVVSNVATDLELTLPNVLDYTVGENFSADGLKVTAVSGVRGRRGLHDHRRRPVPHRRADRDRRVQRHRKDLHRQLSGPDLCGQDRDRYFSAVGYGQCRPGEEAVGEPHGRHDRQLEGRVCAAGRRLGREHPLASAAVGDEHPLRHDLQVRERKDRRAVQPDL